MSPKEKYKLEPGLYEKWMAWRSEAVTAVKAVKDEKERAILARRYYEADQASMTKKWPEMKRYLRPESEAELKAGRDSLIYTKRQNRPTGWYPVRKKHLPKLEQYRKLYGPHVQEKEQKGKGPRFTGQMNKVETAQELWDRCYVKGERDIPDRRFPNNGKAEPIKADSKIERLKDFKAYLRCHPDNWEKFKKLKETDETFHSASRHVRLHLITKSDLYSEDQKAEAKKLIQEVEDDRVDVPKIKKEIPKPDYNQRTYRIRWLQKTIEELRREHLSGVHEVNQKKHYEAELKALQDELAQWIKK